MVGGFVRNRTDVCKLNLDVEALLGGEIVELVVDVVGISNIFFETENSKPFKHLWFVHHCVQVVRVVKDARALTVCHHLF